MRKKLSLLSMLILLLSAPAYAAVYGPFYMRISNALPSNQYNYISVTIDDNYTTGCSGISGALITVTPNQSILVPGGNYGIQNFGLNFNGNPALLEVDVLDDANNKWKVTTGSNSSFGPFGVFVYNGDTTGQYRKNPLRITLCYHGTTPLTFNNFVASNEQGYMFACDVAGFSFTSESGYSGVNSAKFALPAPPATTTIQPTTTTTSVISTTTSSVIPTTTTTMPVTTTTTTVMQSTTTTVPSTEGTTLINLALFAAKPSNALVKLQWETESELDNAGFNIYRAESPDGNYIKINASLITAEGTPSQGASYEYIDKNVRNRRTYYYKLEDIDLNGTATMHGPVSATPRFILGVLRNR